MVVIVKHLLYIKYRSYYTTLFVKCKGQLNPSTEFTQMFSRFLIFFLQAGSPCDKPPSRRCVSPTQRRLIIYGIGISKNRSGSGSSVSPFAAQIASTVVPFSFAISQSLSSPALRRTRLGRSGSGVLISPRSKAQTDGICV